MRHGWYHIKIQMASLILAICHASHEYTCYFNPNDGEGPHGNGCMGPSNWSNVNSASSTSSPYNYDSIDKIQIGENQCEDRTIGTPIQEHNQSPIMLQDRNECRATHKVATKKGSCNYNKLKFRITDHELRAELPINDSCVRPHMDLPQGYSAYNYLTHISVKVPSEHVVRNITDEKGYTRYGGELVLSHNGGGAKKDQIMNIAVFLEPGHEKKNPELQKLLKSWEAVQRNQYKKCGLDWYWKICQLMYHKGSFDRGSNVVLDPAWNTSPSQIPTKRPSKLPTLYPTANPTYPPRSMMPTQSPKTKIIVPILDSTHVSENDAEAIFGKLDTIQIDRFPEHKAAFLKFNVRCSNGPIRKLDLKLPVVNSSKTGGRVSYTEVNWESESLSWSNAPQIGAEPEYDGISIGKVVEQTTAKISLPKRFYWKSSPNANEVQFALRIDPESSDGAAYKTGDIKLEITYDGTILPGCEDFVHVENDRDHYLPKDWYSLLLGNRRRDLNEEASGSDSAESTNDEQPVGLQKYRLNASAFGNNTTEKFKNENYHLNHKLKKSLSLRHIEAARKREDVLEEEARRDEEELFDKIAFEKVLDDDVDLMEEMRRHLEGENSADWDLYNTYKATMTEYFYGYEGRQTSPPCYGRVNWRIIDKPLKIANIQLHRLEKLIAKHVDPNTCKLATVGNMRDDGTCKVDVNRPLQYETNIHNMRHCQAKDWGYTGYYGYRSQNMKNKDL